MQDIYVVASAIRDAGNSIGIGMLFIAIAMVVSAIIKHRS